MLVPIVTERSHGICCETLSNYRPVSALPYVSKCLERVVVNQLTSYLSTHELLDKFQSAYCRGHSTETALVKVTNDILLELDRGKQTAMVMIDISAAFDTIDHAILLDRLSYRYGMTGSVLRWMESYLRDRSESFLLSTGSSEPQLLKSAFLKARFWDLYFSPCIWHLLEMSFVAMTLLISVTLMTRNFT